MVSSSVATFQKMPSVTILDARKRSVRNIVWYRHPDTPAITVERITRHRYNNYGFLAQRVDPRLYNLGQANFSWLTNLRGAILRTQSADAGTTVTLDDAAGRPCLSICGIGNENDRSEAVTRTYQYEGNRLPGRLVTITEQSGTVNQITERFIWGGSSPAEQNYNLAGQLISHYDTGGKLQAESMALTGAVLAVSRQLLHDHVQADWQGTALSLWQERLEAGIYTSLNRLDATGAVLSATDAAGNVQRAEYNVAGFLKRRWLKLKSGPEWMVIKSLSYAADGQKLREEHGNGVIATCLYEPETRRLIETRTERPVGHAAGAKILQDLHYGYDPVGNVVVITNDAEETRFWNNQKVAPESHYSYDSLYQLTDTRSREMTNIGQQSNDPPPFLSTDNVTFTNYSRRYSYDHGDNLLRISHSAPGSGNNYTITMTASESGNRVVLSSLADKPSDVEALFTASGKQKMLQPGQQLSWTPRGELLQVKPVMRAGGRDDSETYRYDAASQRLTKITVQQAGTATRELRTVYLPALELRTTAYNGLVLEQLQVIKVGNDGLTQVRMLYWETGAPGSIANNALRYSYNSLIGSSTLELDGEGKIVGKEEYYPYGGTAVQAARNQLETEYKFIRHAGKERDNTGLYYYGYRYYQPWVGRWLSADIINNADGLNLYCMVNNNPLTLRDPDGRNAERPAQSFVEATARAEFRALDRLIKFPALFTESQTDNSSFRANINAAVSDTDASVVKQNIQVTWRRQIPHFQPTHPSELVEANAPESEAFTKDLHRSIYRIAYASGNHGIHFAAADVGTLFSAQNRHIISTIAHQGHLADISIELYGIQRVDPDNTFSAKRGSKPEHLIVHEGDRYRITSSQQFELKNMDTEQYVEAGNFTATVEQTTFLDAIKFDATGGRILSYQPAAQPSIQQITLSMSVPLQTAAMPVKRSHLFSRLFKRGVTDMAVA